MNKCSALVIAVRIGLVGCIALLLASCSHGPQGGNDVSKVEMSTAVKFADDIVNNRYTSVVPYLDDAMKSQLTEAQLSKLTSTLHATLGNSLSSDAPRLGKLQGYDVVYIPYHFQRGNQDVKVVFDGTGKIGGLYFVNHGSP